MLAVLVDMSRLSKVLLEAVSRNIATGVGGLVSDYTLGVTGADIAILMVHDRGVGDEDIHRLA